MKTSELEKRIELFAQKCRDEGIKVTHQRLEVFREIAQTDEHPDAETVLNKVRDRLPSISLDTVYRTLWLLIDLDLINTLGIARESTRFDANLNKHHHFVCTKCGLVRDFENPAYDSLDVQKDVQNFGSIIDTQLEVHGICNSCKENSDTSDKN